MLEWLAKPVEVMGIMIAYPWIALIPAALLAALFMWCRRRLVLVAAVLWMIYALMEYGNKLRLLCSGECNIRVDLLLIYPLLLLATLAAVIIAFAPRRKTRRAERF